MRDVPHAPGYTLAADAFMRPSELVGFWIARQPLSVFPHFHEFYELALVVEGTGLHVASDGERRIQRGTAIFVAPGISHGYRMGEDLTVYNCFLRVEATQFDLPCCAARRARRAPGIRRTAPRRVPGWPKKPMSCAASGSRASISPSANESIG